MSFQSEQDMKQIQTHISALGEFFDTVQIFVTRVEGENTVNAHAGSGNWFARAGQIKEWVVKQDEIARTEVRSPASE